MSPRPPRKKKKRRSNYESNDVCILIPNNTGLVNALHSEYARYIIESFLQEDRGECKDRPTHYYSTLGELASCLGWVTWHAFAYPFPRFCEVPTRID